MTRRRPIGGPPSTSGFEIVAAAIGEMLSEERKATTAELSDEVRSLRIELSALQTALDELRAVLTAEAKLLDLPRLPRAGLN